MRKIKLLQRTLLLLVLFLPLMGAAQEGTKQFMPNSTDRLWLEIYRSDNKYFATQSASDKEKLYIYLNAGEKMHFGMKMASYSEGNSARTSIRIKDENGNVVFSERRFPSSGTGYISSYNEAVKGPEGVILNGSTISNADGYTPYVYEATSTGNHYIEFETWRYDYGTSGNYRRKRRFAMDFFDVTVTDASNNVITNPGEPNVSAGRLWSKGWAFTTTSYTDYPVKADFYVFTADEFVNKVQYEMKPYSFNFVANSYGVSLSTDDNVIEAAQSQDGDLTNTSDISEYRIFLNDPDRAVWQNTALPPPAVKVWFDDNLIFDYDYDREPQQLSLAAPSIVLEKNNASCPFESITMFKIESNIDGFATVLLDLDGGGYSTDGNDKALQIDLKQGDNYVLWDFTTDDGDEVEDGIYSASATFLGRGPAHFPLYDVESLSGISTYSIRPFNKLGPTLYWDDSQIDYWGDSSGSGAMDETVRTQLTIENHKPRVWTYNYNAYNGEGTTMNSWFNAIDLGMPVINFEVTTGTDKCVNGEAPVLGDIHLVAGIDEVINFQLSDFTDKYYDPNDLPLTEIQIINLPSSGSLELSGVTITAGQVISAANINNISYTPPSGIGGKYTFDFTASNGTNYALQSNVVNLVSNSAPTIAAIGDQTICTNEGLISFPITIGDAETAADDLSVIAYSHDQLAVENSGITISGTGANRFLNVVPIADQSGYAIIYVLVDDGYSQAIEEFALHIGPSVLFTGDVSVCVGGALSLTAEEVGAAYIWKKGTTVLSTTQQLSISNLTLADAGTYSLSVSKGGCAITKEFEVSIAPIVSFTGDVNLCVGETLSLSADETVATSYIWKKGSTTIGSTKVLTKDDVTLSDNGSDYTLEVSKEGCSNASAPFTISVINVLDENLTVSGSQIVEGGSGTITIVGAEQDVVYTAYDASNNSIVSGTGADADLILTVNETDLSVGSNTFTISGDNGNCTVDLLNSATISVNSLPTVSSQVISTDEDVAYSGNLLTGATDDDGGILSAETSPVTPPVNGSVTIASNGDFTYTPDANFNGSDSFTFRVCDDQTPNGCVTADVTITVNAINDAPVLSTVTLSVDEDNDLVFASSDFTSAYTDEEGQALVKIQIVSIPNAASGELQLSGAPVLLNQEIAAADISNLRFVPASNWNGAASFQWKASDGVTYSSASANVNMTVTAQDDSPSFANVTVSVLEDAANNFVVHDLNDQLTGTDNDIDGEKITYSILSGNTSNAFKVDINTGEIAVNTSSAIDFEVLDSYSVVVRATDAIGSFADVTITIDVQNSDSDVVLTIANASITEGDAGSSNMTFTVTASSNVANELNFNFAVAENEATFPEDYSVESGSASILAGNNTTTFVVPIAGDVVVEENETFTVSLNGLSSGSAPSSATGTITDNDNASLTVGDASVSEGDGQIVFSVALSGNVQGGITVNYSMSDGSATGGSDYNNASGSIVFIGTDGESQNITVPVLDDDVVEETEDFILNLSTTVLAIDATDKATGSITNNDGQATVTIGDETVDENGSATFTVQFDKPVQGGFTINYSANDITAAEGTDYTVVGSSLAFDGDESKTQSITVNGIDDAIVEGSETFAINLSSPSALVNTDDSATGTIIDNDAAVVTIEDVTVNEGEGAVFTATLNKAVAGGVVITYNLADSGATKGVDYTEAIDRTITFTGTAGENHDFTVDTQNDNVVESSEDFLVTLASSNPLVGVDDKATGTINDNDGSATVSVTNTSTNEGDNATFTLLLDKAVQGGITINYSTANGTASAGEDYTAQSTTVVFTGNALETQDIIISTSEDLVVETDETFTISFNESHALVDVTPSATATITNDDGTATISIDNATFDENGTGLFVVRSDKAVQGGYTINYSLEDGTAEVGVDFDNTITPINFLGDENESQTISVDGKEDSIVEGSETFTIRLSSASPLVMATGTATGTINDNDVAVITIDDVSVNEDQTAQFIVTLDNNVAGGFTVDYSFTNGTAIGGVDFTTLSTPLTFTGTKDESKTINVTISNDAIVESTENFTVSLTSSNDLVDDSDEATGNIIDNDGPALLTIADVVVTEGAQAEVILKVDKAVQGGFTVDYSTVDGSAIAGEDYVAKTSIVTFLGTLNEQQSIFIDGALDNVVESDETYTIDFSTSHLLVDVQASSQVTVNDDDGEATISVDDISFNENSPATFKVVVDKAVQGGFTLDYVLNDITATGVEDYQNTPNSITFSGAVNEVIDIVIPVEDDDIVELSEEFQISFSSDNLLINTADKAIATILDNDNSALLISNVSASEGGSISFDITLSQAVAGGTNVTCNFVDGTATGGVDFDNSEQVLNFLGTAGEKHTLTIPVTNDDVVENDETFTVTLSSSNALVDDAATAIGTITNNDGVATVSVSDITISEEEKAIVTLTVDKAVQDGFEITYSAASGTAIVDSDLSASVGSVAFDGAAGQSKTIEINTIDDLVVETPESYVVNYASNNVLVQIAAFSSVEITDNDGVASVSVSNITVNEGGTANITLTLDKAVQGGFDLSYVFADITTNGTDDYEPAGTPLHFDGTINEEVKVTVTAKNDDLVEGNETFTLEFTPSIALVEKPADATVTIIDEDSANLTIEDVTVNENESMTFTVTLNKAVSGGVVVDYAITDLSTTAVDDYVEITNGQLNFAGTANETQSFTITIEDDLVIESSEQLRIDLSSHDALVGDDDTAIGTIVDNDGQASIAVSEITIDESQQAIFTLTLDKAVQGGVVVNYQTNSGTAGVDDFTTVSGTLNFAGTIGESQTVTVELNDDAIVEVSESFTIELSESHALVDVPASALANITDNDGVVTISVDDISFDEIGSGEFVIKADKAVEGGFQLDYALSAITAVADVDYTDISGTISFAGTAGEEQRIKVDAINDAIVEDDETFSVAFTTANALVEASATATATIVDDEGLAIISVSEITIDEAQQAVFTLTLDKAVPGGVAVNYQTNTGTAGVDDFTEASGTVNFVGASGESQTVTIVLKDDELVETSESFSLQLSESHVLVEAPVTVEATITDNDGVVTVGVDGISIQEAGSGEFVVKADKAIEGGFQLNYALSAVTATADVDYKDITGIITFSGTAGEEQIIKVDAIDDAELDPNETFTLTLSAVNALVDASATATATIIDDEVANRIPLANDDSFTTDEDITIDAMNVLANDTGLEDGNIVVSVSTQPTNAFVTVNADNTIKLVPEANYNGVVAFTYQVCDGDSDCATASVSVTINAVNDAPVLREDAATINQGEVLNGDNLLVNDSDPEDDALTIKTTPVADVTNGTLVINTDGTYVYTPDADFHGTDEFTYEVCDNGTPSMCASAQVTIVVIEKKIANKPPVAQDDVYETGRNEVLTAPSVLENDSDEDGNTLYVSATPISGPSNGTVVLEADGTFVYTPNADYTGTDSFVYQVCDDGDPSECTTATVEIAIVVKDSDNDVIPDDVEGDGDPDNDGVPNYLDEDSDGDGELDKDEGLGDCDNDEVPNYLDTDLCYEDYPLSKGFSPNGDGINDLYVIPWLNQFTHVSIEIFNRWGNVVYEADKYLNDWDGKSNAGFSIGDELPVGTYYYIITIHDTKQTLKGYIYLNR
ncbi:tandem-95 repeat protein [Carboxylicivirga sp. A043]|uniref:Calx-beta domain-containing protein n=1 Tax=Carboxylicivirga litoralis TaxID=2816963 RepID=UPI0021CB3CCB|nr:Calx-beta domain-containing protein [Carboxylicivirga sp. A043]MCU4157655.1 tandem-95 repeat protein [Carboxylicivirga sp. A043]